MAEQTSESSTQINNQQGTGTVTDTKAPATKTSKAGEPNVDTQKSGESTFDEKVFEDPRLWNHPRFKSLNERAKRADALEKAQAEADEKRLREANKFEELAAKTAKERDEVKARFTQSIQDNRIIMEASKVGVVDTEAVLKLVDRSNIAVDENGNVTGAIEAVQQLLASKPFLKGKSNVTIGSPTNPGADTDTSQKKFTLSQLQDPVFYRDHEKEILAAYKAGLIEDDITK